MSETKQKSHKVYCSGMEMPVKIFGQVAVFLCVRNQTGILHNKHKSPYKLYGLLCEA